MTRISRLLSCALLTSITVVTNLPGAGFVSEQNFVVVVPPEPTQQSAQEFASKLSQRAERYRRQIATAWLGAPIPGGLGRTVIHIEFTDGDDVGLTWAKDDPQRAFHNVYLKTTRDRAMSTTLAHELVHVVLATQYPSPNRLAPWIEEGIASQYDDVERTSAREQMLRWFARSGNWPDVPAVLASRSISTNDRESYTVAAALTEMLVQQEGRLKFVNFGRDARKLGWDRALRQHYRINGTGQLIEQWRQSINARHGNLQLSVARDSDPVTASLAFPVSTTYALP